MKFARTSVAGLVVALGAAAALLFLRTGPDAPAPAARAPLSAAWPGAQRADLPAYLPDGPIFQPGLFLDARTAVGTAPTPDGDAVRLVLRGAGEEVRELRRRPLTGNPAFEGFAAGPGGEVVWSESVDGEPAEIWAAEPRSGTPRRLTADTGDPVFYGSQYDLVVADGRVHWVAAAGADATEIRSVPLAGGPVTRRREAGVWSLSAWPWLTDGTAEQTGTTVLREIAGNREIRVAATGTELTSCTPVWCRVLVMSGAGLARIDGMRPDGRERKRIAGGGAAAAVVDPAVLDRFEVLSEPRPDSDLTGTEGLVIYDITAGRTVELTGAASGAFARAGVVWWSTGDQDTLAWHTVDLRTV
jgi:hypothetical protein